MEYETLKYNFDNLLKGITALCEEDESFRKLGLSTIKTELNYFFNDFKCTEVIFTQNTDNDFFGIQISPMFKEIDDCMQLFNPDNEVRFDHYLLEFDSKLFNGDFTSRQILALLIHDINKLNSPNLLKDIIATMDCISMNIGTSIKLNDIGKNMPFFLFAIQDTARKMTSAFEYIPADLSLADDFIRSYELSKDYEEGMFSIKKCRNNLKDQICCTTITMNWYMHKYSTENKNEHRFVADDIRESIRFTGSKLVKRILNQVLENMMLRSRDEVKYYTALTESTKKKMSLASQIKMSGLKSLEDDVYEYRMRIKNVETENDAIYIIRQINNRMGIISDYLETEDLSDVDKERFYKLYDKYDALREELSKKSVYSRKMYGLFVDYNALQQMSNGSMTMNTYY